MKKITKKEFQPMGSYDRNFNKFFKDQIFIVDNKNGTSVNSCLEAFCFIEYRKMNYPTVSQFKKDLKSIHSKLKYYN